MILGCPGSSSYIFVSFDSSTANNAISDISRQKWAEGFQNRKKHEAIELKRTQESFMDMISHEMRNVRRRAPSSRSFSSETSVSRPCTLRTHSDVVMPYFAPPKTFLIRNILTRVLSQPLSAIIRTYSSIPIRLMTSLLVPSIF